MYVAENVYLRDTLVTVHTASTTVPVTSRSDEPAVSLTPEHTPDGFCWCQPLVEDVPPDRRIFIHRPTLDSLHSEVPQ